MIRAMHPSGRVVQFTINAPTAECARRQASESGLRLVVATAVQTPLAPQSHALPPPPAEENRPGAAPVRMVVVVETPHHS